MAIIASAKKNIRKSARQHVFNVRRDKAVAKVEKQIQKLVSEKKADEARKLLPTLQKAVDKAAKMGTIKENTASRKKSRLSALIKRTA